MVFAALIGAGALSSCSIERFALNRLADALSASGTTFASDDDIDLIHDAAPFSLKLMEALLARAPDHEGLLLAACSGFTQYAYAYVQQDAEFMEEIDLARSNELRARARRLYARARGYGLRALDERRPQLAAALRSGVNVDARLADARVEDVPFLFWTAAAMGGAISVSKDHPEIVADQLLVEALIDRALELNERFDNGAIHTFLISYEPNRQGAATSATERAREHFARAVEISRGTMAAPYVALAEAVTIQAQDRREFEALLATALAVDVDLAPDSRLQNLIVQRRARWLLARTGDLFLE